MARISPVRFYRTNVMATSIGRPGFPLATKKPFGDRAKSADASSSRCRGGRGVFHWGGRGGRGGRGAFRIPSLTSDKTASRQSLPYRLPVMKLEVVLGYAIAML